MLWIPGIALLPSLCLALLILLAQEARATLSWPFVQPEVLPWFLFAALLPPVLVGLAGLFLIGRRGGARSGAEPDPLEIFRR
jgi:hypothetical protein